MAETNGGIGWPDFADINYLIFLNLNAIANERISERAEGRGRKRRH